MKTETKLALIKLSHSIVWAVMAAASFYILYCGITKTTSPLLWTSIGLLGVETSVLFFNKWTCPMTPMAMKYTVDRQPNFDIYLPLFVAKYNKQIFGTIFAVGLLLVAMNLLLN